MLMRFTLIALTIVAVTTGMAQAKSRSAKDQALYEKALKECNGPRWPGGARIMINYSAGWYRCEGRNSR